MLVGVCVDQIGWTQFEPIDLNPYHHALVHRGNEDQNILRVVGQRWSLIE